jgi:hypothetical protein
MMCLCESRRMKALAKNPVHCNIKKRDGRNWAITVRPARFAVLLAQVFVL